jgi:hypothetical protein
MTQQPRIVEHREQSATLDELVSEFKSGTAHLLSLLNSAAVATPNARECIGDTDGTDDDGGSNSGSTAVSTSAADEATMAFAHELCALGHGVVHILRVAQGEIQYDPSAFQRSSSHPPISALLITSQTTSDTIVEVIRSLLHALGVTFVLRDGVMVDAWCQSTARVAAVVDAACQAVDVVNTTDSGVHTLETHMPVECSVNSNAEVAIVDFEREMAAALRQDAAALAPSDADAGTLLAGGVKEYPGLTAVARLWVRSCIEYGVLHACTHTRRLAPQDPYGDRFRGLDRTRLSDELVREVSHALDCDDRDLVLFLTDRLSPPDFDALSEMIAENNMSLAAGENEELQPAHDIRWDRMHASWRGGGGGGGVEPVLEKI